MALLDFLNPLSHITDAIVRWQTVKENAKNDSERIEAEVNIKTLEAKRDVQVAATVHDKWWSPRTLIGYSVAILVFKLLVYDTAFQLGVTPWPGSFVTEIAWVVIGFYFVSEGLKGLIKR